MNVKSGWQTSEFWVMLVVNVLSYLGAFGVISQDDATTWKELIVPLVPGIVAVVMYVWSRTQVKTKT